MAIEVADVKACGVVEVIVLIGVAIWSVPAEHTTLREESALGVPLGELADGLRVQVTALTRPSPSSQDLARTASRDISFRPRGCHRG